MFLTPQQKYIRKREELIRFAEAYANQMTGKKPRAKIPGGKKADPDLTKWCDDWNRLFHNKMAQICKEFGITKH